MSIDTMNAPPSALPQDSPEQATGIGNAATSFSNAQAPSAPDPGGLQGAAAAAPPSAPSAVGGEANMDNKLNTPQPPPNPAHKVADSIIHAFLGTDGTPGSFLKSVLAGGLAGVAANAKAPHHLGDPILGGFGIGAEAGMQNVDQANQKVAAAKQQQVLNQQKQQQLDMEQNRDKYLNMEANARMLHEQALVHQAGEDTINKSIDSGKQAVSALRSAPIPGEYVPGFEEATADDLKKGIALHTANPNDPHGLDPSSGTAFPTGRKVVGENADGTPKYATTYSFMKLPPEVTLDDTNRALLEGVPGYDKMTAGTKMSGTQFNSLYQESSDIKAATAARDKFIADIAGSEEASKLKLESVNLGSEWNNALANNGNDPFPALNAMQADPAMRQKYPHLAQDVENAYGGPKEWETMRKDRAGEGSLTSDKAMSILAAPGAHSKPELDRAQKFLDVKNNNTLNEAVALTKAKGIATGKDYETFLNYGRDPNDPSKTLNVGNAPDNMLLNGNNNSVIPIKMQQGVKPSQQESNRADFAKSVLHTLDMLDTLKAQGKLPNGPITGVTLDALAKVGLGGDDQEARDLLKFAQSAATGAHVGGRFSKEIMSKMDQMISMNMNDTQFASAEAGIRDVMKPYSENGGRLTVGEYKNNLIGSTVVLKDGRKAQVTGFDANGNVQGVPVN